MTYSKSVPRPSGVVTIVKPLPDAVESAFAVGVCLLAAKRIHAISKNALAHNELFALVFTVYLPPTLWASIEMFRYPRGTIFFLFRFHATATNSWLEVSMI